MKRMPNVPHFRFGFNKWRDPQRPTHILAKFGKGEGLNGHYNNGKVQVEGVTFRGPGQIQDESGMLPGGFKALNKMPSAESMFAYLKAVRAALERVTRWYLGCVHDCTFNHADILTAWCHGNFQSMKVIQGCNCQWFVCIFYSIVCILVLYTIQYNTIQYNTIQYNTIQYNLFNVKQLHFS